jgi:hypothetical protein
VTLYLKKNAPWRRVVRTVRIAEGQFYDELECGHRESHDCTAKKRFANLSRKATGRPVYGRTQATHKPSPHADAASSCVA